jgi:hypothetical protein
MSEFLCVPSAPARSHRGRRAYFHGVVVTLLERHLRRHPGTRAIPATTWVALKKEICSLGVTGFDARLPLKLPCLRWPSHAQSGLTTFAGTFAATAALSGGVANLIERQPERKGAHPRRLGCFFRA